MGAALEAFQLGLEVHLDKLTELGTALDRLERAAEHTLNALELRYEPGQSVVALLGFNTPLSAEKQKRQVGVLAHQLGGSMHDVQSLEGETRVAFEQRLERMRHRTVSAGHAKQAVAQLRRLTVVPVLRITFKNVDELLSAWARIIAEGALWMPSQREPSSDEYSVMFVAGPLEFPDQRGRVVQRSPPPGDPGFWLDIDASEPLLELIALYTKDKRAGRPVRSVTSNLEARFDTLPHLAAEYATDISRGGLFVRCSPQPELRTRHVLRLVLPDGQDLHLACEVVHRVLSGASPGVGVQFVDPPPGALEPLEQLVADYNRHVPRVLVIDDEAIWRLAIARALKDTGCEVMLASDGHEGLLKLVDELFDLDLIILDLHMPELDGPGLLERIRRLGGETALKVFVFSGAVPDELEAVTNATAVFSKADPLDKLIDRVKAELRLNAMGGHG